MMDIRIYKELFSILLRREINPKNRPVQAMVGWQAKLQTIRYPMKTTKNKLLQNNYDIEQVEEKEQNNYIRRIAYWIGYFIVEFNNLESIITNIITSRIHGMDFNGYEYVFLTGLMFNQKVELLERLYKYEANFINPESRKDSLKKKASELIAELKELGRNRNTIVHTNYYSLDKNGNIKERTKFSDSDA